MTLLDISFLQRSQRVPGRSILLSFICQPFIGTVTDPGGGATSATLVLPSCSVGYIRQWELINASHSAPATGNLIALYILPPNLSPSQIGNATPQLARISFLTGFLTASFLPIIGGVHVIGTANGPVQLAGGLPIVLGNLETLVLLFTFTAASGVTLAVQGRYCDFPI